MKFIQTFYKLLIWVAVIGVLCFTPGDEFKEVKINIPHFDKVVHFGMFYVLGLFIKAIQLKISNIIVQLTILALGYAGLIELIQQYFIPVRNGDIIDFIFDSIGLFVGIYTFTFYPNFAKRILKPLG